MWAVVRTTLGWGIAVAAIAVIVAYLALPEHRKRAGQTFQLQGRTWISTSVRWNGDETARDLEVELLSIWGLGEVYFTHIRLQEFCQALLGRLPNHKDGEVDRDTVQSVSIGISTLRRAMTENPITIDVHEGDCTKSVQPAPVQPGEGKIRTPSAHEAALNAQFLAKWRNLRTSFMKGVNGDGLYFEFVPQQDDRDIADFDFFQACRLALSRMPETQQTQFGLLDYLERGALTFRVWEFDGETSQDRPRYETRKFKIVDRDCVENEGDRG